MKYKKIINKLDKLYFQCCDLLNSFSFFEKGYGNGIEEEEFSSLFTILKSYAYKIHTDIDDLKYKLEKSVDNAKNIPLWGTTTSKGYTAELSEDNSKITIYNAEKEAIDVIDLRNPIEHIVNEKIQAEKGGEESE